MSRIDQVNEMLRSELANAINKEISFKDFLVTISYIDCSPDLENAKVNISVLPDKYAGTALTELRKNSRKFSNILKKQIRLRKIPKLNWVIDNTEKNADEIDKLLEEIRESE